MTALHFRDSPADILRRPSCPLSQTRSERFGGGPFPLPGVCQGLEGTIDSRASIMVHYAFPSVFAEKLVPYCSVKMENVKSFFERGDILSLSKTSRTTLSRRAAGLFQTFFYSGVLLIFAVIGEVRALHRRLRQVGE